MARDVKAMVRRCGMCAACAHRPAREPLLPHVVLHLPWIKVGSGIFQHAALPPSTRYVLHRADSGAIKFQVKCQNDARPVFKFTSKYDPQRQLYEISLGSTTIVKSMHTYHNETDTISRLNDVTFENFVEFWVHWHNKKIQLGLSGQHTPFLVHKYNHNDMIGYVQFEVLSNINSTVEWIYEVPPIVFKPLPTKIFDEDLTWVNMRTMDNLPANALIGGFEKEPIYVARALSHNSLIPGKYDPVTKMAYVPWGHREHAVSEFEILCGHNAKWVKAKHNVLPPDSYVAGYSEVRQEPLYVGRAMYRGCLLVGKVHLLYNTCYLPYQRKEIETTTYEILTVPKRTKSVSIHDY